MDEKNKLYFGDNLKILREYVPEASVDLIYLDPPFNSSATYNAAVAPTFRACPEFGEGSARRDAHLKVGATPGGEESPIIGIGRCSPNMFQGWLVSA
jgi:hypothetical protein